MHFVESRALPLVDIQIDFAAGTALDPAAKAGLASMTQALLDAGAGALDEQTIADRKADIGAAFERLTLDDAFRSHAGFGLIDTCSAGGQDRDRLAARAKAAGIRIAADDTWSDLFSRVLVEKIEPHLGDPRPTLLYEYPAPEAALARPVPGRPDVAERFELYVAGVELANGFGELTDAAEQRQRLVHEMDEKARLYGERYPLDEDFLAALAEMPAASGCALGFDRLVMLAAGASRVDQVIWTPLA